MRWDWQVFLQDTGGGQTYLDWMLSAWGWTLSVALCALVVALLVGSLMGILRTTPRVESHHVPTDAEPERVRMDSLQLQQKAPDVSGPEGNFDLRCFFDCFTVTRTVNIPSDSSDPLG